MNTFKKVLGFTLILTIFWLLDVYNALVDGSSSLLKLNSALAFIFLGFYLKKKERWIRGISFLIALLLFFNLSNSTIIASKEDKSALIRDKQSKGLNWEPWSYEKMEEHKKNQENVFIDFTAKWCFTCKVNEKLVLDTESFKDFIKENNLKLLIGDWTKRDEVIRAFLLKQGLVGVPAYFIQKKDGTLVSLGETVSLEKIKTILGEKVDSVKISTKIESQPAIITNPMGMSANMERILKAQALASKNNNPMHNMMFSQKNLEINPEHNLIKKIDTLEDNTELINIVYESALLSGGYQLDDINSFLKKMYNYMN
jgi:hypothetical protein